MQNHQSTGRRMLAGATTVVSLLALLVPVTTLASAPAAHADTTIVSCVGAEGSGTTNEPITTFPVNPTADGRLDGDDCVGFGAGAGITGVTANIVGTALEVVCVPVSDDFYLGLEAAGTVEFRWRGGPGPETTVFSWVVAGAMQVTPTVSVIEVVGHSSSGRFHDEGSPALLEGNVLITDVSPDCPGSTRVEATGDFAVIDPA